MPDYAGSNLRGQWSNPGDILSFLLLIGGNIIQMAIAQLVGYNTGNFARNGPSVGIAPVAFSFGWVAYGFTNLLSAVGERRLMPLPDCPAIVVNCANGFIRVNQSWALGRLLRDHEMAHDVDPTSPSNHRPQSASRKGRAESIRIDIFELGHPSQVTLDLVWWFGWMTIGAQIVIASLPWILYGNWGTMMIVLCGNLLALLTCALPQWRQEKWAGRTLDSPNVTCLTRGNGNFHIMVFIGSKGSWDLETLATATSSPRPETPIISLALAVLWTCLLITVAGLKEHTWYLIGIGGIGMLQNVHAAGKARDPGASNFHLKKFSRMPTIIGKRQKFVDDVDAAVDLGVAEADVSPLSSWLQSSKPQTPPVQMPTWLDSMERKDGVPNWLEGLRGREEEVANIQGALKELEKWVPTAGLAMLQVFFPGSLQYKDETVKHNVHKKFWKRAFHTKSVRRRAEHQRRSLERVAKGEKGVDQKRALSGSSEV